MIHSKTVVENARANRSDENLCHPTVLPANVRYWIREIKRSPDTLKAAAILVQFAESSKTGYELSKVFSEKGLKFNLSETSKHHFIACDLLKFETLPRKYRTLLSHATSGNTFSTLEGLEFEWTIEPDAEHQISGNVLQNILYADSSYLTPPTIGILESQVH